MQSCLLLLLPPTIKKLTGIKASLSTVAIAVDSRSLRNKTGAAVQEYHESSLEWPPVASTL